MLSLVVRTCEYAHCCKSFTVHKSEAARGGGRFCSTECRSRARFAEPAVRFWKFVQLPEDRSQCWLWHGSKTRDGHGVFRVHGKHVLAHRFSYALHTGGIDSRLNVNHCCPDGENPSCVNPAHLYQGTQGQNMQDAFAYGKRPPTLSGEQHPMVRLTTTDVIGIRTRHAAGETYAALAQEYGVHVMTICKLCLRKTWAHIP